MENENCSLYILLHLSCKLFLFLFISSESDTVTHPTQRGGTVVVVVVVFDPIGDKTVLVSLAVVVSLRP